MSNTDIVRASRDGDYFHYLWAARRCLALLAPHSTLVAITIEGQSPAEVSVADAIEAGEELIDVGEYYGSQDLKQASLVRYIQLKHSTRNAYSDWTASGLEKTLRGFAERYKAIQTALQPTSPEGRLEFWFVSNRPISTAVREAVEDAANQQAARHPGELAKIERFTGLSGADLARFCKLVRFGGQQPGYWDQRNILAADVRGYLPDSDVDAPTQLKELVTRKALSESETNPTITKMDVLRALKTDESSLLPAPCLIELLSDAVPREQEADLVRSIVESDGGPIIVHADGGIGKSIFASRIPSRLPEGSFAVLYDCFGRGQYRNASGYRHRHKQGLVQIANELAGAGLCHLLIPTQNADSSAYIRAFIYRLGQAVASLRSAYPNALLCLIVDAADNAQMAAVEIGESRSFIKDLLREGLPEGVRLVALCRTHRQALLDPPSNALRLELKAFSRTETAAHLRQSFPDASEHDIDEFHRLTSQNPRVQSLALAQGGDLSEILRSLGPNPTTVDQAIESLLDQSIAKLKDQTGSIEQAQIDKICVGLAALRPLIPISVLSSMSGVDAAAIRSFAYDLGRPLRVSGDTIQFLDEPSETWFRDKFKPTADDLTRFIDSLKRLSSGSAYVASALPQLMLEAGHFDELVKLALSSEGLPETGELERRDVDLQRLQFALKASLRLRRYKDAAKLALKTGGESAGDKRQRQLIQENTDLATIFLSGDRIEELVSRRTFGAAWLGSHNAYEAGLMSGRPELVGDARSRLRMAFEWVGNWGSLSDEERRNERMELADIAEMAIASFNIHGPEACARHLRAWRPADISFRAGQILADRFVDHGRFADLDALATAARNDVYLILAIATALAAVNRRPPRDVVERTLRLVRHPGLTLEVADGWSGRGSLLGAVTILVEAAIKYGLSDHATLAELLTHYLPETPPRGLASHFDRSRVTFLRAYCLRAALQGQTLRLIDLAYPELRQEMEKENKHHDSHDAQDHKETVGALLPWHLLRAQAFVKPLTPDKVAEAVTAAASASSTAERIRYREESLTSNEVAVLWCKILVENGAADAANLDELNRWVAKLRRPPFTPTLRTLARLSSQNSSTNSYALAYIRRAYILAQEERDNAESQASELIELVRCVLPVSASEARAYFNEAMGVASKIGDENLDRWLALLDLADRAARSDRPAPEIAYRLSRAAELTYAFVVRDKHFDWRATVRSIAALCPSSGLAILARWRDRAFGWDMRLLPAAIEFLTKRGAADPVAAAAFLGFRAEWNEPVALKRALDACSSRAEKEAVASHVLRYLSLESQSAERWRNIKAALSDHGLQRPEVDEWIAFEERDEQLRDARQQQERASWLSPGWEDRPGPRWDDIFSGADLTTPDGISVSYRRFRSGDPPFNMEDYFRHAFAHIPPGRESEFIAAIKDVADFNLYHLRSLLEYVPETWKQSLAVKAALALMLKNFCRRFCMGITKSRYYEVLPFKLACELSGIPESELFEVVLTAIGDAPELVGSERLFTLVGILASQLTEDDALEALSFGLDLLDPSLRPRDGDGPWSPALAPPNDVNLSLAGYVWGALASPRFSVRWEAAHVVRALCALGRVDVIGSLVNLARTKTGGPFADASLFFYGMHAQLWLMIALARAAKDYPHIIVPHTELLQHIAFTSEPHVLMRHFAGSALRSLLEAGLIKEDDLSARLDQLNNSSMEQVQSDRYKRVPPQPRQQRTENAEDNFYFGMDMGQYWFSPLGLHFAKSQGEVERQVLHVIRNDWGYTGNGSWEQDERAKRKIYREGETYARHSEHPRSDDLGFYLSYHALMVVAGKLLATVPLHFDPEHSYDGTFPDWIADQGLARRDGGWLADRRDPPPREWPDWKSEQRTENWHGTIARADLDRAFGLANGKLNVWGYWTINSGQRVEDLFVRSALVPRDRAASLLRASQSSDNPDRHYLPHADDHDQLNKDGFELKGWITHRERTGGLDDEDPWAGQIKFPPPGPASFVMELMGLRADSEFRTWSAAGHRVMWVDVWGYYREKEDEDYASDSGERVQASFDFLVEFLRKMDMDMIVKVEVERRLRVRHYERSENDLGHIPGSAKYFLIRTDGSIATL